MAPRNGHYKPKKTSRTNEQPGFRTVPCGHHKEGFADSPQADLSFLNERNVSKQTSVDQNAALAPYHPVSGAVTRQLPYSIIDPKSTNGKGVQQMEALRQAESYLAGTIKLLKERLQLAVEMKTDLGDLVGLLEDLDTQERAKLVHDHQTPTGAPGGPPDSKSRLGRPDESPATDQDPYESDSSSSSVNIITSPTWEPALPIRQPPVEEPPREVEAISKQQETERAAMELIKDVRAKRARWNIGGR